MGGREAVGGGKGGWKATKDSRSVNMVSAVGVLLTRHLQPVSLSRVDFHSKRSSGKNFVRIPKKEWRGKS